MSIPSVEGYDSMKVWHTNCWRHHAHNSVDAAICSQRGDYVDLPETRRKEPH